MAEARALDTRASRAQLPLQNGRHLRAASPEVAGVPPVHDEAGHPPSQHHRPAAEQRATSVPLRTMP